MKRAHALVNFIQENRLEMLIPEITFTDRIIFEFKFNKEHVLEYNFETEGDNVIYDVYYNKKTGDWDYVSELTPEDALRMRTEYAIKAVNEVNKGEEDE